MEEKRKVKQWGRKKREKGREKKTKENRYSKRKGSQKTNQEEKFFDLELMEGKNKAKN
jgi:hypothetical protein